jgi:thiamine biosynthesis lipoprotein ApbE
MTVLADDAATADALATALFVMPPDKVSQFCSQHPEIQAIALREGNAGSRSSIQAELHNVARENVRWLVDDVDCS